ncbi:MAG: hypothetical protein KME13_20790 [Myxacorys californica WJT36-NPBG1]|jgi:hypothetical protein|nr:hypothetical protein [Myxacorys californica WJT36-NPBG1]
MDEFNVSVPVPQTIQELDEAVRQFNRSDWSGDRLYQHWRAIRDASLEQLPSECELYPVPGSDSY